MSPAIPPRGARPRRATRRTATAKAARVSDRSTDHDAERRSAGVADSSPVRRQGKPTTRRTHRTVGASVVVIEDDADSRRTLRGILELERYHVSVASGGEEALALMEESTADLVVMDWRMPGLSGAQLVRRLRNRPHAPPVVVVSSADEAFELAGDEVAAALRKPVDVAELRIVIAAELGRAVGKGQGRRTRRR